MQRNREEAIRWDGRRWDGSCTAVPRSSHRERECNGRSNDVSGAHRANAIVLLALTVVIWVAAGQLAPAALTLTLSQRERGPGEATLFPRERGSWDVPSCRLEERLFRDAADGRLDELSPLDAALVAGGVDDADCLRQYQQKAAALADELRRSEKFTGTPRQRAEVVFEFLHRRVLYGGYDLAYTDLRRVLDDGRFNCVSATVLFNYFGRQCGLDCRGLEMPGHAMSRVGLVEEKGDSPHLCKAPSGPFRQMGTVPFFLDIENTCPRWLQGMDHPRQQTAAVTKTIGAVGLVDRSKAREVSPIQLAAMIYYNRGVDLLGEKRFDDAARANAKALRLDPRNATARGNLLATLNNWSIELGNCEHFAEAVDLLRQGLAMDPKFAAFAQNYVHVHRQWANHLCRQGQYAEAVKVLSRAAAEMPDRDCLRRVRSEVCQRWAKAVRP